MTKPGARSGGAGVFYNCVFSPKPPRVKPKPPKVKPKLPEEDRGGGRQVTHFMLADK